jgi:hypothetical protein
LIRVLRGTWLATILFLLVSTGIWWRWLSWGSAKGSILPTIIICPLVWWWLVARRGYPQPIRGLIAGALIGLLTQVLPDVAPMAWQSHTHPGPRDGEEQVVAMVTVYFYLMVGIVAVPAGALLGLLVAMVQKHTDRWISRPA